jgi:hypothetical protein
MELKTVSLIFKFDVVAICSLLTVFLACVLNNDMVGLYGSDRIVATFEVFLFGVIAGISLISMYWEVKD